MSRLESIRRVQKGSVYLNSDILRTSRSNQEISTDICGKKSANGTKFDIGGDFRWCRFTLISSDGCGVSFHWDVRPTSGIARYLSLFFVTTKYKI
jgi:hypothetical protein